VQIIVCPDQASALAGGGALPFSEKILVLSAAFTLGVSDRVRFYGTEAFRGALPRKVDFLTETIMALESAVLRIKLAASSPLS
jgi:hypothetical protein